MTGFDIFDRYDFAISMIFGVAFNALMIVGAPLWALVLIMFACSVVIFIRHFDDFMGA
jgi:hypothetical protein